MLEPVGARSSRSWLSGRLGMLWCHAMHDASMWPIHGTYRCRSCGRSYLVPWAARELPQEGPVSELEGLTSGVLIQ